MPWSRIVWWRRKLSEAWEAEVDAINGRTSLADKKE